MGPQRPDPAFHLGTSGWSYAGWKGLFYPPGLPSRDWLAFYARHFATVEINMTFYRLPRPETLKGWVEKTPPDFRFSLKANRLITHFKRLRRVEGDVRDFYILAGALGRTLGCILFQLPASIERDLDLLDGFLRTLSAEYRNVIEFRHGSWYDERVFELMRKHRTAFCTVPSGVVPDALIETSEVAYFRFHGPTGRYDSSYSDEDLARWAAAISRVGARDCFVYFNNDAQAFAVRNALKMRQLLCP